MTEKIDQVNRMHRLFFTRMAALFFVGVLLILLSLHIEAISMNKPLPIWSWLKAPHTWASFTSELGIACLVALLIISFVDLRRRHIYSQERRKEDDDLKKNAFLSVFRVLAPPSVIDKTFKLTLGPKFVRKTYRSLYIMSEISGEGTPPAVLLTSYDSYRLQNLTREKQEFEFKVVVEDTSVFRAYKSFHIVKNLKIGGIAVADAEIKNPNGNVYRYCINIEPEDEVDVSFEVTVVRNLDDTEIFYATYPCDSFTAQLMVDTKSIKGWGAFAIHDSEAICKHDLKNEGYGEWLINDTILPYQGLAMWWRSTAPTTPALEDPR